MDTRYSHRSSSDVEPERCERTVLQIAAQHGSVDVVQYLLTRGADPNKQLLQSDAKTAMHCAALGTYTSIFHLFSQRAKYGVCT